MNGTRITGSTWEGYVNYRISIIRCDVEKSISVRSSYDKIHRKHFDSVMLYMYLGLIN